MSGFTILKSLAAVLPEADINTDVIIPARFLLLPEKAGLGRHLFQERRVDRAGTLNPNFILNRAPFDRAQILVAGRNFGCGSSREQAVWALFDFGIRCVIAPSFGEIFFANCFKGGVLPIALDAEAFEAVLGIAERGAQLEIDLTTQTIRAPGAEPLAFSVDPYQRRNLALGLDEIGGILADDLHDIERFEARHRLAAPWLFADGPQG